MGKTDLKYQSSQTSPKIPGFEWQEARNKVDRDVFREILTVGCSILSVTSPGTRPDAPADLVYSVGVHLNLLHPEFLIMGVPNEAGAVLLKLLAAQVEAGDHIFEDQTVTHDFGHGEIMLMAKFVPQERFTEHLSYAAWFYRSLLWKTAPIGTHKFPVLQLFWPDAAGHYPGHPACDPKVKKIQSLEEYRLGRK